MTTFGSLDVLLDLTGRDHFPIITQFILRGIDASDHRAICNHKNPSRNLFTEFLKLFLHKNNNKKYVNHRIVYVR